MKDAQLTLQGDTTFEKESLNFVGKKGIQVCRGKLEQSDLEVKAKFPIILPKHCHFTDLNIL